MVCSMYERKVFALKAALRADDRISSAIQVADPESGHTPRISFRGASWKRRV